MPVGTAATVKAMTPAGGRRDRRADPSRQHLSPDAETGGRTHRRARRAAPLYELAARDPDRFRRVPGHVAVETAQDRRGRRRLSLASRRQPAPVSTPERSIEIQHLLGADITMAFDECTPFPAEHEAVAASMELTLRWAERSRRAFVDRPGHGIIGIVQGGVHPELRRRLGGRDHRDRVRRVCGRRARDRRGTGNDFRRARRDGA